MAVDGYFERVRMEDDMFAHYTAAQMAVHIEKKEKRPSPESLKMLPKRGESAREKRRRAEEDKAAMRRLREFSRRRNQVAG